MVFIKKKVKRDESATVAIQDEFQLKGFELLSWFQRHRTWLFSLVAVLLIAIIAVFSWIWMGRVANEHASVAYHQAMELLGDTSPIMRAEADKMRAARKAFDKLAKEYARSKVAGLAQLNSGHLSLELDEPAKAIATFEQFLKNASSSDKLRPLAMMGLANAYEANHNAEQAKKMRTDLKSQYPTLGM